MELAGNGGTTAGRPQPVDTLETGCCETVGAPPIQGKEEHSARSLSPEEMASPKEGDRAGVEQETRSHVPSLKRFAARRQHGRAMDFRPGMPQQGAGEPPKPPKRRVVYLSDIAASVTPLHRYFSFAAQDNNDSMISFSPPCARCPNCKGCQLHMEFCSGAYGMRHLLSWIVHRRPPSVGERRTIELHCGAVCPGSSAGAESDTASSRHRVCRFEVGPVVITRSIIYTSLEQAIETAERGGKTGPFAGMVCPRPLNFLDIFFGVFLGTTNRGRDKRRYRFIQHTAMRAVAAQARALWEKLTFSPEKDSRAALETRKRDSNTPPRRVPVNWRYPPLFFSLLPNAPVGNRGITFVLWLSEIGRQALTAHVIEDDEFWRAPYTCETGKREMVREEKMMYVDDEEEEEEEKEKREEEEKKRDAANDTPKPDPTPAGKWEGEVKCRRCYVPGSCWGLICRRHREDLDKTISTLRARRSCTRKGVVRRSTLRNGGCCCGPMMNEVIWINKHKTRAQFMALLVGYMMRTTVCGPYRQRHLPTPQPNV